MSNNEVCPAAGSPRFATPSAPSRNNLSYSFGLPGGAYCLGMARSVVRRVLAEHGLGDMVDIGVLAASELLGNAVVFTPGRDVSLAVRWRFGVLRVTVFDEHPEHAEGGGAGSACRAYRRRALAALEAVVGQCGGVVGLAAAEKPLSGSRLWVVVPREAGRRYAGL
ncbi:ATP-binding protein [Streptomyces sp. NPDC026206]|uniref:ATP-binding protein n=1 Tax=Streptomyces sp. NPDC026206 TaxID=3157089 RepID=UPI0033E84B14